MVEPYGMMREPTKDEVDELAAETAGVVAAFEKSLVATGKSIVSGTYDFGPNRLPNIRDEISEIEDAEGAKKCISDLKILKELLERERQYKAYAKQYLVLECQMWLRIADLYNEDLRRCRASGDYSYFTDSFKSGERLIIEWLSRKSDDEQMMILATCADGKSISRQRRDEVACLRILRNKDDYENTAKHIKYQLANTGRTTCSIEGFFDSWAGGNRKVDVKTAKAYVERTRDEILRSGAVGIGDGKGTYIVPTERNRDEVAKAILNRINSIISDIGSLNSLCDELGMTLPLRKVLEARARLDKLIKSTTEDDAA